MFIHENIEISFAILQNRFQLLVDQGAFMLHLIQNRLQQHHVAQHVLLQNMDLVQHNISVQHQVMGKREQGALRHRTFAQRNVIGGPMVAAGA